MFRTKKISIMLILVVCLCNAARGQDHARLGSEAFGQGDWREAIEHYTQAVEAKPSFGLHVNLGHCYTRLERWAEAASAYEAAIELDSESVTAAVEHAFEAFGRRGFILTHSGGFRGHWPWENLEIADRAWRRLR